MAFAKQIQGSGAVSWQNIQGEESAPDFKGIFETAGAVAGEVFSGMAVDDLLGSDEIPTTSVSNPLDPAQPGMVSHTRGIPDVEAISGLKGIRAARDQGILSGSRAQTMATRRLNEALNQYPQYRDQLLNAYDGVVDPLGTRTEGDIFSATVEEENAIKAAEQRAKNNQKALEAGYTSYEEYVLAQKKMRIQAEETSRQDLKLEKQENIFKARSIELESNIYRNTALVEAELGAFILQQVSQEGSLAPQTISQLDQQITNAELQAKAKLARFKANPQFDYDTNLAQLESTYAGLRAIVKDNSVMSKTQALLDQLKVSSEADQWTRAPAVATLLAMGNSSGLDMIQALQRITGDQGGQATVQDQLEAIVSDPKRAIQFKTLIENGLQTADFNDEDMDFFTNNLNAIKDVITDKPSRDVVIQRMAEIGNTQTAQVVNGTKEAPPIDEVVNGSIMTLADPKNRAHYESPEGKEVAMTYIANTLNTLEKQVTRDAKGSIWEIDDNGRVVGYMRSFANRRIGAAYSPEVNREMLSTQNTMINKGLLDAFRIHPSFLQGTTADEWKTKLVDELNRISSEAAPPPSPLAERVQNSEPRETIDSMSGNNPVDSQIGRNQQRNASTRETVDRVIEGAQSLRLPTRDGAESTPLQEQPQAQEIPTLGAVENMNNVDWDFIRQEEGFETTAYVPDPENSQSGVTVGAGVDLGQWDAATLTEMGVSDAIIEKVTPYLGKKKKAAQSALRANRLNLSETEAVEITDKVKTYIAKDVEAKFNESTTGWSFSDLPEGIATAILSVGYQYGNLPSRTPKFWKAVTNNDWIRAYKELRDFGDRYPSRRNREADMMYAGIQQELGGQLAMGDNNGAGL